MIRFITLLLFLSSCMKREFTPLHFLIHHELHRQPKAYFSYPGRFNDIDKKRNVVRRILEILRTSQKELIIYAYSLNNKEIIDEIQNARERGVKLHIVLDKDKNYEYIEFLKIPYLVWEGTGLHHLKIIISDKNVLFLGTGNFSEFGLTNDWNGYIEIPISISFYEQFFEHLNRQNPDVNLSTHGIEFLFAPENGFLIQDTILHELENAKESIRVLTFDHYDEVFSHVLRKKSSQGIKVDVIYNEPVDPEGLYLDKYFYGYESKIYKDGNSDTINTGKFNEGGLLHHKTILIDNRVLLTGSYNFSLNAKKNNREIFLRTQNPLLVWEFSNEFERIQSSSYPLEPRMRSNVLQPKEVMPKFENDRVCIGEKVGSSVVELGSGIFKTYLRYDRMASNPCFLFSSPTEISSGISEFSREKSLQSPFLWQQLKIYPRFSGDIFNSEWFENFPEPSEIQFLALKTFQIENGETVRIQFQNPNISRLSTMKLFIPGSDLYLSDLRKEGDYYFGKLNPLDEYSQGMLFFKSEEGVFSSCFCKRNLECKTVLYLQSKINYEKREGNQCLFVE